MAHLNSFRLACLSLAASACAIVHLLRDLLESSAGAFLDFTFGAFDFIDCNARLTLDHIGHLLGMGSSIASAVMAFARRGLLHARYVAGGFALKGWATV